MLHTLPPLRNLLIAILTSLGLIWTCITSPPTFSLFQVPGHFASLCCSTIVSNSPCSAQVRVSTDDSGATEVESSANVNAVVNAAASTPPIGRSTDDHHRRNPTVNVPSGSPRAGGEAVASLATSPHSTTSVATKEELARRSTRADKDVRNVKPHKEQVGSVCVILKMMLFLQKKYKIVQD